VTAALARTASQASALDDAASVIGFSNVAIWSDCDAVASERLIWTVFCAAMAIVVNVLGALVMVSARHFLWTWNVI
jgi:hypothetical protein